MPFTNAVFNREGDRLQVNSMYGLGAVHLLRAVSNMLPSNVGLSARYSRDDKEYSDWVDLWTPMADDISAAIQFRDSLPENDRTTILIPTLGSSYFPFGRRVARDRLSPQTARVHFVKDFSRINPIFFQLRYILLSDDANVDLSQIQRGIEIDYRPLNESAHARYNRTIMASLIRPDDYRVFSWAVNVFCKDYGRGGLPAYIERTDDLLDLWMALCIFYGYIVIYARELKHYRNHIDLYRVFLEDRDFLVGAEESITELRDNYRDLIRLAFIRGTNLGLQLGDFRGIFNNRESDALHRFDLRGSGAGWVLGRTSPNAFISQYNNCYNLLPIESALSSGAVRSDGINPIGETLDYVLSRYRIQGDVISAENALNPNAIVLNNRLTYLRYQRPNQGYGNIDHFVISFGDRELGDSLIDTNRPRELWTGDLRSGYSTRRVSQGLQIWAGLNAPIEYKEEDWVLQQGLDTFSPAARELFIGGRNTGIRISPNLNYSLSLDADIALQLINGRSADTNPELSLYLGIDNGDSEIPINIQPLFQDPNNPISLTAEIPFSNEPMAYRLFSLLGPTDGTGTFYRRLQLTIPILNSNFLQLDNSERASSIYNVRGYDDAIPIILSERARRLWVGLRYKHTRHDINDNTFFDWSSFTLRGLSLQLLNTGSDDVKIGLDRYSSLFVRDRNPLQSARDKRSRLNNQAASLTYTIQENTY